MISILRVAAAFMAFLALPLGAAQPPYKILHVMSYHSPWRWTDGQLAGFKEAMGGAHAEYRVFQMDTKQNSTPEAKRRKGMEARALIDAWKPDLVYTTDDDAQEFVAAHYVNGNTPSCSAASTRTRPRTASPAAAT